MFMFSVYFGNVVSLGRLANVGLCGTGSDLLSLEVRFKNSDTYKSFSNNIFALRVSNLLREQFYRPSVGHVSEN